MIKNNRLLIFGIIVIIVVLIFGYFYLGFHLRISSFPEYTIQNITRTTSSDGGQVVQAVGNYKLVFAGGVYRLASGDREGVLEEGGIKFTTLDDEVIYEIKNNGRNGFKSATIGDGFGVWTQSSESVYAKKDNKGDNIEQDLWMYDFTTREKKLLLDRFDNNLNPNAVAVVVSGRNVVLPTFANQIIIINVDTNKVTIVDMFEDYKVVWDEVAFIENKVVLVGAVMEEQYRRHNKVLIEYNVDTGRFKKLYETKNPSRQITELRFNDSGEIFWEEYGGDYSSNHYYKLKIL